MLQSFIYIFERKYHMCSILNNSSSNNNKIVCWLFEEINQLGNQNTSFTQFVICYTQFAVQVKCRLNFENKEKHFKSVLKVTLVLQCLDYSASFVLLVAGGSCCCATLEFEWRLYYHLDHVCGIAMDFIMFLHNYFYFLSDYISISQHLDPLHCLLEFFFLFRWSSQRMT